MPNGNTKVWTGVATGVMVGVIGLATTALYNIDRNARIAIDVAAQHGDEMNMIRGEISALRQEIYQRTDDRYKGKDAERYQQYIERRLEQVEEKLDRLE